MQGFKPDSAVPGLYQPREETKAKILRQLGAIIDRIESDDNDYPAFSLERYGEGESGHWQMDADLEDNNEDGMLVQVFIGVATEED